MTESQIVEQIWVSTTEAAEITGYNSAYLQQLASKCLKQPEEERPIKVRNRSARYQIWLPDLIFYLTEIGHGPKPRRTTKE